MDAPDPSEFCSGTASTTECQTPLTIGTDPSRRSVGWTWDVVADRAGSYILRAEVVQTSVFDPDFSSNTASVTVVVSEGSGGAGGGSSAGATTTVSTSTVKLSPAKPTAGPLVTASVRVTADGSPVRPAGVACSGTLGGAKVKGTPKAAAGAAACSYRTPKAARGKTLKGAISFTARGKKFTKRFTAKLG